MATAQARAEVREREQARHAEAPRQLRSYPGALRSPRFSALVHNSDNGPAMKGATLKATLERLGILASYSRPGVSDDNPYVESLFRHVGTMKSRVGYPKNPFETLEEAQGWVNRFVQWYNEEHRHSALNWVTPMARHTGAERKLLRRREETYCKARQRHPQRWSRGIRNCSPDPAVTLNPRKKNNDVTVAA